jgi:hypothetical protein
MTDRLHPPVGTLTGGLSLYHGTLRLVSLLTWHPGPPERELPEAIAGL